MFVLLFTEAAICITLQCGVHEISTESDMFGCNFDSQSTNHIITLYNGGNFDASLCNFSNSITSSIFFDFSAGNSVGEAHFFQCTFSNCKSSSFGAAIYCVSQASSTVYLTTNSTSFVNCSCVSGGGIYCSVTGSSLSRLTIFQSVFKECTSSGDGGAFFIYSDDSSSHSWALIENSLFKSCGSTGDGATIFAHGKNGGFIELNVTSCTLFNGTCTGEHYGGGICYFSEEYCSTNSLNIADCHFIDCTSIDSYGGGLYLYASSEGAFIHIQITSSDFSDCRALQRGGGAFLQASQTGSITCVIWNVTFSNCVGSFHGGGVRCAAASSSSLDMRITLSKFTNCSALGSYGGGISCTASSGTASTTIALSDFRNCTSLYDGAAIGWYASKTTGINTLNMTGSAFAECHASSRGAAIYCANNDGNIVLDMCECNFVFTLSSLGSAIFWL